MSSAEQDSSSVLDVVWPWRTPPEEHGRPPVWRVGLQVLIPAAVAAFLYLKKPFDHAETMALLPAFFACLNLILGLVYSKGFLKVEAFFMLILYGVGVGLSWILLVPLYWTFFTIAHFFLWIRRKDPLHRKLDPSADSYWVVRDPVNDPATHYRRQY